MFEYQGYWWLPDTPDNRVPGTLVFDPEAGASLELLGSLQGLDGVTLPLDPELILGISSDGKSITLKECSRTMGAVSFGGGFATSTFSADMVFVGEHFEQTEDVGFERLIVEYLHLDAWADTTGFEVEMIDDPDAYPITVRHRIPEPMTARVRNNYEVTLFFGGNRKWSARPVTEVTLTQPAELVVRFPEKQPLQNLLDVAYDLQHFLSLGMRRSVHPVAVWGATGPVGEAIRVEIHYRALGREASPRHRPERHQMLFSLRDLPGGFGPAIQRWLETSEILGPVYRLYLGTVYNPQAFLEQRFLNLVQALEVYHRRAMDTTDLPEEEHERRKQEILDAVPERHRAWLEDRLEYSNEPSLGRRLKEIIRRYPDSTYPVAGENSRKRDSFVFKVVATRNYRTHFDQNLEDQAVREVNELHEISQKLRKLLEVCLLGEIGFEDAQIRDLLARWS